MPQTKTCPRCEEKVADLRAHRKYCPKFRLAVRYGDTRWACEANRVPGPIQKECWKCGKTVANLQQHKQICSS